MRGGDDSCDDVTSAGCETPGYGNPGCIDPRTADELNRDSWWYGEYGDPNAMPYPLAPGLQFTHQHAAYK